MMVLRHQHPLRHKENEGEVRRVQRPRVGDEKTRPLVLGIKEMETKSKLGASRLTQGLDQGNRDKIATINQYS